MLTRLSFLLTFFLLAWLCVGGIGAVPAAAASVGEKAMSAPYEVVPTLIPGEDITQFGLIFRSPRIGKPAPGVIVLHGWATPGTVGAALVAYRALELQQAGYVAMALSLRGWPETGGEDDCGANQPQDVARAVRWFSQQPGVDGDRIALVGHAQGGQVALLTGALDVPLRGIAAYAPVTDLELWSHMTSLPGIKDYLKDVCSRGDGLLGRSPVNVADQIRVPVLLVHGTADEQVPIEQSQRMLQAMALAGWQDVKLVVVADAAHHWSQLGGSGATLDFLRRVFKGSAISGWRRISADDLRP
jgi:dipeptidyl aminopeptidase/acylaminoacyl peptidase